MPAGGAVAADPGLELLHGVHQALQLPMLRLRFVVLLRELWRREAVMMRVPVMVTLMVVTIMMVVMWKAMMVFGCSGRGSSVCSIFVHGCHGSDSNNDGCDADMAIKYILQMACDINSMHSHHSKRGRCELTVRLISPNSSFAVAIFWLVSFSSAVMEVIFGAVE